MINNESSRYLLPGQANWGRGLKSLAALNSWERAHLPHVQSASGRDLYLLLADLWALNEGCHQKPLKAMTLGLTSRTMRLRIRDFEKAGLIRTEQPLHDARMRIMHPTLELLHIFDGHTSAMRRIFREHFVYASMHDTDL